MIEDELGSGGLDASRLRRVFDAGYRRRFAAQIFGLTKSRVDLRVYVTDGDGRVLFDSLGRHEGEDFHGWRDVSRTLQGEYGARTSLERPDDPDSAVMYVAAPLRADGRILGVVSVGKPVGAHRLFVATARQKLLTVGLLSMASLLLLLLAVSVWVVRPIGLIADFLRLTRGEGVGVCPWTSRCGLRRSDPQVAARSPGSRTRCFRACTGSLTARGSVAPRGGGAPDVAFR